MTKETKIEKVKRDSDFNEIIIHKYFEEHIETLIDARLVAREYKINKGRIDTLCLDSDNRPVIIEYKRDNIKNALIQSLFYADGLKNNKRQFYLEVKDKFGLDVADNINGSIRVILVAQNFDEGTLAATEGLDNLELYKFSFYDDFKICNIEYLLQSTKNSVSNELLKQNNIEKTIDYDKNEIDYNKDEIVISKTGKEIKTNLYRYNKSNKVVKDLYYLILNLINEIDPKSVLLKMQQFGSFKNQKKWVEIVFKKDGIIIQLLLNKQSSDNGVISGKGDIGHGGSLHSQTEIRTKKEFEDCIKYIKESFQNTQI